jgi:hypothetical protein
MPIVMGQDGTTHFYELIVRLVVLGFVDPPRADCEVRRSKTVAYMIDRWQVVEMTLVVTAGRSRFIVVVLRNQVPSQWLSRVFIATDRACDSGMNRTTVGCAIRD